MAMVNLSRVEVLNNPASFTQPFSFDITFEVFCPLSEDLEFKVIYVGSPESEKHDQVLESVMVGPVPVGVNKFNLEANPPDPTLIPSPDLLEVTIVFLTVSYRDREFVRVGYYVYTQYGDEALRDDPPSPPRYELLQRSLLASDPRVTRYTIAWDDAAVGTAVGAGEVPPVGAAGEEAAGSVGEGLARAFREEAMAAPFKIAGLNDGAGVGVAVAGGVGAGGVQLMED